MEAEPRPLLVDLAAALAQWRRRRRLADLLPPLFSWCLVRFGAERGLLFTEDPEGGYRVWGSRDADGESIPAAERSISHFAVMRAAENAAPTLFSDTRADRRYRTEAERERGVRSRSILITPISADEPVAALYLDSRFRVIDEPAEDEVEWQIVRDLLAAGLAAETERHARRELERRLRSRSPKTPATSPSTDVSPPTLRKSTTRTLVESVDFHGFVTCSTELAETLDEVRTLSVSTVPVLIEGESGTGKELLARAIHSESGREGNFVTLHCGTVPESLVEVELFGHREGAFTGADRDRPGLIAHARGGTLFLDAIEEASPTLQAALLRVLETGRYRPLAADEEVDADARVISTVSFSEPPRGEKDDDLRLDLYYRLAGGRVRLPPLRDRRVDIVPIMTRLFERAAGDAAPPVFGPHLEAAILAHDWPGNAREIENLARRIVALGETELTAERFQEIVGVEPIALRIEGEMRHAIDRAEREVILRALAEASGNKSVACGLLGMSRRTLYRRMQKHGIPL